MADRVMVSRQAVSRWETGETQPNIDTLKILSKVFDVSINTLLGSPRQLICQCCGMPLEDQIIGRNEDGSLNEDYCKWCYADGTYTYSDMDDLIDVCARNMVKEGFTEEQARIYLRQTLPKLDYWKRYEELGDGGRFEEFKKKLVDEIDDLHIEGMPKVEKLNALVGKFVNLEYRLPNGMRTKFLDDQTTYLGTQLESEIVDGLCFGVLANGVSGCSKSTTSGSSYCYTHKCKHSGCKNYGSEDGYCSNHSKKNSSSNSYFGNNSSGNKKTGNSGNSSTTTKQCVVTGCHYSRIGGSCYCTKHKCARSGCTNKADGSGYCSRHHSYSKDPYDVYDYNDPEDFYFDWEDDFEDFEDAEDYWDDAWN